MSTPADTFGIPLSLVVDAKLEHDEAWIPTPETGYAHPPGLMVGKTKARCAGPDGQVLELTLEGPLKGGLELLPATFSESYLMAALEAAREWTDEPTDEQARYVATRLRQWATAPV